MRKDLILIIDMQKVYLPGNPWGCPGIHGALERILKLIGTLSEKGESELAFTRFLADPEAENIWKRYNEVNREINEDPEMNELLPELLPYIKEGENGNLYDKSLYSSFSVEELRRKAMECTAAGGSIVLSGVVAECCVLSSFFQAVDMGCHLIYLKDAVAGVDKETEQAVEKVMEGLCPLHAEVMSTEEYIKKV